MASYFYVYNLPSEYDLDRESSIMQSSSSDKSSLIGRSLSTSTFFNLLWSTFLTIFSASSMN